MKRFLYLFVFCFCSLLGSAQNEFIDQFYEQHKSLHNHDKAENEIKELIADLEQRDKVKSNISTYKVIHQKDGNGVSSDAMKQLVKNLRGLEYEELVRVNESGTIGYMMCTETQEKDIGDLFVIVHEEEEFLFFTLSGNMNLGELMASGFSFSFN